MKHARTDYDRIQDPAGIIPENEPVLLIRGQDALAPAILRRYAESAKLAGSNTELVDSVFAQADRMEAWQKNNGRKVPDMPVDAVLVD